MRIGLEFPADRRITFYRRCGALNLGGIDYTQSVGWQPSRPMLLMIHPFAELDGPGAFALAQGLLEDAVRQSGELTLA